MKRRTIHWRRAIAGLALALFGAGPSLAASIINSLPPTTFPLPDPGNPATSTENLWISNGTGANADFRITPTQAGYIFQGNCALLTAPFRYELCWNTTQNPTPLQVWSGTGWSILGYLDYTNNAWILPPAGGGIGAIASAPTTDLGTVFNEVIKVSGSATITSLGASAQAGTIKVLLFSAFPVITANSLTLILPQNQTITAVAGDSAVFLSLGSGAWQLMGYQRTASFFPQLPDLTTLQQARAASYQNGVWRDDYGVGYGAPALFYIPETGTCAANSRVNDGGSCVDTTAGDGNSFHANFSPDGVDAREFGYVRGNNPVTNNAAIQAAANAAYSTGINILRIPTGGYINGGVAIPQNVTIACGGLNAPLIRDSAGPLFNTTSTPGNAFNPQNISFIKLKDCAIDNNNLPGTGFLTYQAYSWEFDNVSFYGGTVGAHFLISGIANGVMTVPGSTQSGVTSAGGQNVLNVTTTVGLKLNELVMDNTQAVIAPGTYINQIISSTQVGLSAKIAAPGVATSDAMVFTGLYYGTISPGDMALCAGCGTISGQTNAATAYSGSPVTGVNDILSFLTSTAPGGLAVGALVADCGGAATLGVTCGSNGVISNGNTYVGSITTSGGNTIVHLVNADNTPAYVASPGVSSGDVITFSQNTYYKVDAYGTNSTTGTGGIGTYQLSGGVNVTLVNSPSIGSEPASTATPYTWSAGPASTGCHKTGDTYPLCNKVFPSAEVSFLGVFSGNWLGGFVGNTAGTLPGPCTNDSGIAIYGDSSYQNGAGKFNSNNFYTVSMQCAVIGAFIPNGTNNTFYGGNEQFVGIAAMIGTGIANSNNNSLYNVYFEGGVGSAAVNAPQFMAVLDGGSGASCGPNCSGAYNTTIFGGQGSLDGVVKLPNGQPYVQTVYVNGTSVSVPPNTQIPATGVVGYQDGTTGLTILGLSMDSAGVLNVGNGTPGDKSGTVQSKKITLNGEASTPLSSYTPTIKCGTGSFTTYTQQTGFYSVVNGWVHFSANVQGNANTCSGFFGVSLPTPSNAGIVTTTPAIDGTTGVVLTGSVNNASFDASTVKIVGTIAAVTNLIYVSGDYPTP